MSFETSRNAANAILEFPCVFSEAICSGRPKTEVHLRSASFRRFKRTAEFFAGITRTNPISYTFLGYCMEGIEPAVIPVEEALRSSCTVSVCHDPQWTEFESWIPAEPRGLSRVAATLRSLLYKLYARR